MIQPQPEFYQWSSNGDLHLLKSSALQIFPLILPLLKLHRKQTACHQNIKHCWLANFPLCILLTSAALHEGPGSSVCTRCTQFHNLTFRSHWQMRESQLHGANTSLAGSRWIRRHNSCWLRGKSLARMANYNNLLLNSLVPTSNKWTKISCLHCSFFCSTGFKQARWEGPSVSIIRSLLWSLSRETQKLKRSLLHLRNFYWHKADTKGWDLCQSFTITFISCSHWETNLCIKVSGAHKLCSSSSSTEVCSRQETEQLTVE